MTEEDKTAQVERISEYVVLLNPTITDSDADVNLLAFTVSEILDRVRLYLNRVDVPVDVERMLGKTISSIFNKYKTTTSITDVEQQISSVSDNGQSVSYSTKVKNYLTTGTDEEIFTGVEPLLRRYRGLNYGNSTRV